jgi:hypothetical protein
MNRSLVIAAITTMSLSAAVKIEKTAWQGWPNCYRVTNGEVELIVTSDIGPRIMRYGFVGGQNLFWEQKDRLGKSGEPAWVHRGGHRVWVGPEDVKYTYPPDNLPVIVEVRGGVLIATQPVEKETGIQKQIEVRLDEKGSGVTVVHRLINKGNMPLEYAVWALTMMAPGGRVAHGFPPRGTHPEDLQPTNPLVMWAFSDLTDPRWKFTKKYLMLQQVPGNKTPTKLGSFNARTFGAYFLNGDLFIKRYAADAGRQYPDMGCSFETFTNADFLEIETMGPLSKVPADSTLEHIERWSLHKAAAPSAWSDEELDRVLLPLLQW